jgi:phosphoglycolate phosphatase-like HAD superfamily hydrolase
MFSPVIGADDVSHGKPHPEGILRIREMVPHNRVWYIGDTVDDARAAKAAGVPFIGVAAQNHEVAALLKTEGAQIVLEDINALPAVVCEEPRA